MLSGSACSAAKPRSAAPVAIACAMSALSRSSTSILMSRVLAQEGGERPRQMLRQARGIGEQQHARPHAAGVGGEIAAHRLDIVDHDPGMIEQAFTGRGQLHAAPAALEQRHAERRFQALDPLAGGSQRQMRARLPRA